MTRRISTLVVASMLVLGMAGVGFVAYAPQAEATGVSCQSQWTNGWPFGSAHAENCSRSYQPNYVRLAGECRTGNIMYSPGLWGGFSGANFTTSNCATGTVASWFQTYLS